MTKIKVTKEQIEAVEYLLTTGEGFWDKRKIMRLHTRNNMLWRDKARALNGITYEVLAAMLWFPKMCEVDKSPEEQAQEMYNEAIKSDERDRASGIEDTAKLFGYTVKEVR